jgi:hypothetical protein
MFDVTDTTIDSAGMEIAAKDEARERKYDLSKCPTRAKT